MRILLTFILICFAGLLFTSCERDILLPLKISENMLVVDASIENGRQPVVILSTSFNYFSKITPDILAASFVHQARIVVKNGFDSVLLKEYSYPVANGFVYFYTTDTAAATPKMTGRFNSSYFMTIDANGTRLTSHTTIPLLAKTADSLWAKTAPGNSDTLKRILFARVTDPPGLGNYIRYFTSVNDSAYLPGLNSVFDDDVVDGTTYNIQVFKGVDRSMTIDTDEYGYFKKGDTVVAKLCNIDRATFDFWRTLEYSQQSVGNPFSQPGVVLGNVTGALGYFGGYAAQYKKTIITN